MRQFAYIGTYTSTNGIPGNSKGIYTYRLDSGTGKLIEAGEPVYAENPTYFAIDRDRLMLYSVLETDRYKGAMGGAVASFSIDGRTGLLGAVNMQLTNGKSPCHIFLDRKRGYIFTANYYSGSLTVLGLRPDGGIEPAASMILHEGNGLDPIRQEMPHTHFVTLSPDKKFLCAVDLGTDKVYCYDCQALVDYSGNCRRAQREAPDAESFSAALQAGCGPRHMVFSLDGRFAYVVNELASSIAVLRYDPENLLFEEVQYITTLPDDWPGTSYSSAIRLSPDGRHLYASNRGHDSLAVFSADPVTGKLEAAAHIPAGGCWPRDFDFDLTGDFLFALNQESDSVVTFRVDKGNGLLERLGYDVTVPGPACIKFISL